MDTMMMKMIFFSWFAGITVFIGGIAAYFFNHHVEETPVKYRISHTATSLEASSILTGHFLLRDSSIYQGPEGVAFGRDPLFAYPGHHSGK